MWNKKTITKLQQAPHAELLRSLVPFRNCDDGALDVLARQSELVQVPGDYVLFERASDAVKVCFVVDGDIKLVDASGGSRIVSGGSVLSHIPLNPEIRCAEDAIVLDTATVMRLDRGEIERVIGRALMLAVNEQSITEDSHLDEEIYLHVYQALRSGTLELPSMPSTGVHIAKHLEDPAADSDSIARIIQMDPALTARLIQVANSPAFKGRVQIESCRDAVTRLGQSTTRDLVISFVLRGLFRSRNPHIRERMEQVWLHSTQVAAISYALARKIPGLDAGQAMLAGLMHDIGVIPILTSASRYPRLADDADLLDKVVSRLRGDSGAMVLKQWGFAPEFIDVALHAEDWQRQGEDQADYTDLVIIAQMHSHIGTSKMAEIPRIDRVPAFQKLAVGGLGPGMSLRVMDEAEEEISAMRQALQ
ncbi:MAG: HDOD domain-containing protein [Gammaproteobacteria bacterium]